jgi:hypothetical protein
LRNAGPLKKELVTKVVGLETQSFDIGNGKYAVKYRKSMEAIANHIQKEYKGGPEIAKAIREMNLPTTPIPNYLTANLRERINPGEVFLWQQDVQGAKNRIFLIIENKKHVYALVLGQSLAELDSKIKELDAYVQANTNQDMVQLLAIIQGYCC